MTAKMNSDFVIQSIKAIYPEKEWAFFPELRIGGGFADDSRQRLDIFAVNYYPSKRNCAICFEVKVGRGDFLKEIQNPIKRRNGMFLSNQFYFAAPAGLIKIEEVPYDCGLMEVSETGEVTVKITAPYRDTVAPTWNFLATVCRRIVNEVQVPENIIEEKLRGMRHAILQTVSKEILKAGNRNQKELEAALTKIHNNISSLEFDV